MRRVLIAIGLAGMILAGIAGYFENGFGNGFENDASEVGAPQAPRAARSAHSSGAATPVGFDLLGESSDEDAVDPALSRVEHAVFWRTESGIPETQPTGIPTSFADLSERVAPAEIGRAHV